MSSGSNNHNYDSVCKSAAASVEIDFKTMERVLTTLEKRDTFINMCLSGVTGYIPGFQRLQHGNLLFTWQEDQADVLK